MVFACAHVALDRDMERDEAVDTVAARFLELGEPVQHSQIHIVRVGLGNLPETQVGVTHRPRYTELLQLDGSALARRVLEFHCFRQLQSPFDALLTDVATTCPSRTV